MKSTVFPHAEKAGWPVIFFGSAVCVWCVEAMREEYQNAAIETEKGTIEDVDILHFRFDV